MQSASAPTLPPDCAGRSIDLAAVREQLAPLPAQERLRWAQETFGDGFALTTSFGIQAAVLLAKIEEGYDLPPGAVIGTSSQRRQVQVRQRRPDLIIKDLRGNINTRMAKCAAGEYDAIILASAGLERLARDQPDATAFVAGGAIVEVKRLVLRVVNE